ncbi:MAG: DUF5663 domain-containing protein [Candidatus Jacksonbacteria bacterium]
MPTIPIEIQNFLEDLLEDAELTNLTPEVKEQMLLDLYARLDSKLISAALMDLPAEYLEEFNQMLARKDEPDKINAFLQDKIPNLKIVFGKAMLDFRNSYLGLSSK